MKWLLSHDLKNIICHESFLFNLKLKSFCCIENFYHGSKKSYREIRQKLVPKKFDEK